eukprot:1485329-Amphidinium_carterae.1
MLRVQDAADRIQKMLDQNWWIVHCSAAPFDIEPLAILVARWWRKTDRHDEEGNDPAAGDRHGTKESDPSKPKGANWHLEETVWTTRHVGLLRTATEAGFKGSPLRNQATKKHKEIQHTNGNCGRFPPRRHLFVPCLSASFSVLRS